ncbi:hypothetical protein ACLOJK_018791 [Asimina triloba]
MSTQFAVIRRSTEHQYGAPSSSPIQPICISFTGQPFTHQQASRPLDPTTRSHCPADGSISPPRHLRPRLFRPGQQLPSRHGGQHLRVSTHPIHGHDQPIRSAIPPKSGQQLHDWPSFICDHGSPSILHASGEQPSSSLFHELTNPLPFPKSILDLASMVTRAPSHGRHPSARLRPRSSRPSSLNPPSSARSSCPIPHHSTLCPPTPDSPRPSRGLATI